MGKLTTRDNGKIYAIQISDLSKQKRGIEWKFLRYM